MILPFSVCMCVHVAWYHLCWVQRHTREGSVPPSGGSVGASATGPQREAEGAGRV